VKILVDKTVRGVYNSRTIISEYDYHSHIKRGFRAVGGGKTMSEVHIKDNESLDNALRRFKRSCAKSGVMSEIRKREHYESPSVKRRKKSEAARKKKYK